MVKANVTLLIFTQEQEEGKTISQEGTTVSMTPSLVQGETSKQEGAMVKHNAAREIHSKEVKPNELYNRNEQWLSIPLQRYP